MTPVFKQSWFIVLTLAAPNLAVSQTPESELLDGELYYIDGVNRSRR
jgi:hypothetical protein